MLGISNTITQKFSSGMKNFCKKHTREVEIFIRDLYHLMMPCKSLETYVRIPAPYESPSSLTSEGEDTLIS